MFDSRSFHAAGPTGEIRDDLAFKIAAQLSSKKGHDFLGAKAQGAVAEQFWVEFRKVSVALEQNVGREFTLSRQPVVLAVETEIPSWLVSAPSPGGPPVNWSTYSYSLVIR